MEQLKIEEEEKKRELQILEEKRKEEKRRIEEKEKEKIEQLRIQEEEKKRELQILEEKRKEEKRRIEEKEKEKIEQLRIQEEKRKKDEERKKEIIKKEFELLEQKRIQEEEIRRNRETKNRELIRIKEEKIAEDKREELEEITRKKKDEEMKLEEERCKQKVEKRKLELKLELKSLKNEKDIIDQESDKTLTKLGGSKEFGLGLIRLEERRRQWVQEHTPWSSTTSEDRTHVPVGSVKSRQRPRRPFSASRKLPSLTEDQLLQASPPGTSLNKVIRVCISSLPACNMDGMKSCPELKSLSICNCGLITVEGLEVCTNIKELIVKDNHIEYINCNDLHNLEDIQLNNNSLTSVQGLEGCKGLGHLDLANNKITRLGDLSSCYNLQTLCLDKNQLIMTKRLSSLPNLQTLSCAYNHLPNVKEIDSCQLLQCLNLKGNNLQQPPLLSNHVLLKVLILDDNSISTLKPLSQVWLPSLHLLSVSQNSISRVDSLEGLILLETLDVSYNLISDLECLTSGLTECKELKQLRITGNPVNEEPLCRKAIREALEFLTKLDDETLDTKNSPRDNPHPFVSLCLKQQTEYNNMMSKHAAQLSSLDEKTVDQRKVKERLQVKSKQHNERHELAVTHLQQHEQYGTSFDEQPKQSHYTSLPTESEDCVDEKMMPCNKPCVRSEPKKSCDTERVVTEDRNDTKNEDTRFLRVETPDTHQRVAEDYSRHRAAAAVKIQSVWRGWYIRHLIETQMKKWLAAVTIQATWRGYQVRSRLRESHFSRAHKALWDARHHAAATKIQACYRGYRVRQRVTNALRAVQYDYDDDDGYNYNEEVDLSALDFDSRLLDEGWTPTDTPQLPSRGPILPDPGHSSGQKRSKESNIYMSHQAWRSADSPMEIGLSLAKQRRSPEVHSNHGSPEQDLMSVTSGAFSHLTRHVEEMSNEWGLTNQSTAELMWKRANRMKYNPARKRKLLDPNKRLALFKRLDEANKLREVKPPPKRQLERVDYFAARDASRIPSGSNTPTSERETKAQMTYSWVYNQGVLHEDQDFSTETKTKQPSARRTFIKPRSTVSLPHMDPVLLTGRHVPLVSSPALMQDQISKDSTTRVRSYSSASEQIHFPPIKTHSVPNLTARSAASQTSDLYTEKSNSAGARMTKQRKR